MYKIGVIGDRTSVTGFRAVGLDVFPCKDATESKKAIRDMVREGFAIIYITEELATEVQDEIDKYKDEMLPAIIPIPSRNGSTGEGMHNVRKAVERAVGADILFGGDN